jgi:hypothetical protein
MIMPRTSQTIVCRAVLCWQAGQAVLLGPTQASVAGMNGAKVLNLCLLQQGHCAFICTRVHCNMQPVPQQLICVTGPNMNPERPDCLHDDYDAGDKVHMVSRRSAIQLTLHVT